MSGGEATGDGRLVMARGGAREDSSDSESVVCRAVNCDERRVKELLQRIEAR